VNREWAETPTVGAVPADGAGSLTVARRRGYVLHQHFRYEYPTPIRHLRPVAASYPHAAAIAEADRFLTGRPYVTRAQAAEVLEEWRTCGS
jgi:hypothetical protein